MDQTYRQIMEANPAPFRLRCICRTSSHPFVISKPGTETRRDSFCVVCAAQLEAFGYTVRMEPVLPEWRRRALEEAQGRFVAVKDLTR